jgi:hypothetical protein
VTVFLDVLGKLLEMLRLRISGGQVFWIPFAILFVVVLDLVMLLVSGMNQVIKLVAPAWLQ